MQKIIRSLVISFLVVISSCATQRPPVLVPFSDGEYWMLGNELVYKVRETGERIVVPRGFVTDFASVPRVFWTVFPKHGEYTRAAIVHDYLYWQQQCTRLQADELFDIVMEDSDVDTASRYAIYAAVRVWGGSAWEENTQARSDGFVRIIPEHYMNFPIKTRWQDYRELLRNQEENEQEEYPSSAVPSYCEALQQKEKQAEEKPVEIEKIMEDEEQKPEILPDEAPVPDSAIGA